MHVQLPCSYRGPIGPYVGAIPGGSSLLRTRPALSREGSRVEVFYCHRLTSKTKDPPYGNSHFPKTGFGPSFLP